MAIPNPSQMSPSFIVPAMKEAHDATIWVLRLVGRRNVHRLGPRKFEELVFVLKIPQHSAALPVPVRLRSVRHWRRKTPECAPAHCKPPVLRFRCQASHSSNRHLPEKTCTGGGEQLGRRLGPRLQDVGPPGECFEKGSGLPGGPRNSLQRSKRLQRARREAHTMWEGGTGTGEKGPLRTAGLNTHSGF